MKLLQTLIEAAAKHSTKQASSIVSDSARIETLAATVAKYLKKTFGEKLLDTPMAVITQHARSCIDSELETKLSKDDLDDVTRKVLSQLKPHLEEGAVSQPDAKQVDALAKTVAASLKKLFGKEVLDQPIAIITQHTRSQVDAALKNALDKDELEAITHKVLAQLKNHLKESNTTESTSEPITESLDTVQGVMSDVIGGTLDLEDVMMRPRTPGQRAAAKIMQRMYDTYASESGLHVDDDFEKILVNVGKQIEQQYGNRSVDESITESDDFELHKAAQAVIDGKLSLEAASKQYKITVGELKGEINLINDLEYRKSKKLGEAAHSTDDDNKKVSSKALAKSMEDDGNDGDDADIKKADSASKDAPKKIVDTSIKPEELKSATAKLPKQIAASLDSYSVKSAFELNKKLRADFPDITSEQLKQASVIWKSDNT